MEDDGEAIAASDADMAALDGRNSAEDQFFRAVRVVLRVIFGPLITQRELGMCCYLLNHLMGTQFPLVKALDALIVTIDEKFSSFSRQMVKIHQCTSPAYNVSCIVNTYLNKCIKASATYSTYNMGGRSPTLFRFIIDEMDHGRYQGQLLPLSLCQILLARKNEKAEAARNTRHPPPPGGGGRTGGGGATAARG